MPSSDCDAISDTATHNYIVQHFNGSLQVQAQQSIRGGTDLNCGALYGEQIAGTVRSGLLREEELDLPLERVYTKAFQLGIIDQALTGDDEHGGHANPNPYGRLGPESVDTPAHRALALEGAIQGQVLLKNEAGRLPLRAGSVRKLALIGPHANGTVSSNAVHSYRCYKRLQHGQDVSPREAHPVSSRAPMNKKQPL